MKRGYLQNKFTILGLFLAFLATIFFSLNVRVKSRYFWLPEYPQGWFLIIYNIQGYPQIDKSEIDFREDRIIFTSDRFSASAYRNVYNCSSQSLCRPDFKSVVEHNGTTGLILGFGDDLTLRNLERFCETNCPPFFRPQFTATIGAPRSGA